MSTPTGKTLPDALRALLSTPIGTVVFVEDYVQIGVSGGRMTILEPLNLAGHGHTISSGDPSFADELKSCTGASIEDVRADHDEVAMRLSNGKTLGIALSEPSGTREAFIYQDETGRMWVAGPD